MQLSFHKSGCCHIFPTIVFSSNSGVDIYIYNLLLNEEIVEWLIDSCLTPTLAVYQVYGGVENILIQRMNITEYKLLYRWFYVCWIK